MAKKDRVGEVFINNEGYEMVIIEYNNANDLWIQFEDEYKVKVRTSYINCQNGSIKNPYHPSVFGKCYLGLMSDGTRPKTRDKNGKHTREYKVWYNMVRRVYDSKFHEKNPTYKDCILEDCLHCFAYFLEHVIRNIPNYEYWLEHPNEGVALDKDVRGNGSKVYSRDTLMFVSQSENSKEVIDRYGGSTRQPTKVYGVNVKTGEKTKMFNSVEEASKETGANNYNIYKCMNNKYGYKTVGGYKWFKVE